MADDKTLHEFTIDTPVMQAFFNSGSKWPKGFRAASKGFRAIANNGVRKLLLVRLAARHHAYSCRQSKLDTP